MSDQSHDGLRVDDLPCAPRAAGDYPLLKALVTDHSGFSLQYTTRSEHVALDNLQKGAMK